MDLLLERPLQLGLVLLQRRDGRLLLRPLGLELRDELLVRLFVLCVCFLGCGGGGGIGPSSRIRTTRKGAPHSQAKPSPAMPSTVLTGVTAPSFRMRVISSSSSSFCARRDLMSAAGSNTQRYRYGQVRKTRSKNNQTCTHITVSMHTHPTFIQSTARTPTRFQLRHPALAGDGLPLPLRPELLRRLHPRLQQQHVPVPARRVLPPALCVLCVRGVQWCGGGDDAIDRQVSIHTNMLTHPPAAASTRGSPAPAAPPAPARSASPQTTPAHPPHHHHSLQHPSHPPPPQPFHPPPARRASGSQPPPAGSGGRPAWPPPPPEAAPPRPP